ncbi:ABC transporter substrate-binding protein [Pseudopedobacter saltans]|nr:ABC transporter substrate-binding protein [Pseudopedobacter saltans]
MRNLIQFVFTCFIIISTCFYVAAQPQERINLQLKWYHQFQFAGYYAAHIKKFYEKEGLDVHFIEGGDQKSVLREVTQGHADFGITGSDILYNYIEGSPVVVTSVIFQHSPYTFMTLKKSGIRSPLNLYKRKVMASGDQGWFLLRSLFFREGIPPDSIKLMKHSWNNQDLIDEKVDAISAYSTVEPFQLKKKGYEVYLISPRDYGLDFYGDLIFTSKRYAENNADVVEAFNRASIKGWEYALAHKEEMITYILGLPGVKERNITREHLEFEANETENLIYSNLVEIGHINTGRFQNMLDMYKELKIVPASASIDGLVFEKKEINWEKISYTIILIAVFVAALFSVIFIWNRRLVKIVNKKTKELKDEVENRKIAEEIARQNELKLKLAIKGANIGLWEWDVYTQEFTISKQWCFLLGLDFFSLPIRKNIFDFIHPQDIPILKKSLKTNFAGIRRLSMHQLRLLNSNGDEIHVLISFRVIKTEVKKGRKLYGVVVNIDNIKKQESSLLQLSEELMHSNKELKKFAYITSHNLRAPVVNIVALMSMFEKKELTENNVQIFEKLDASVTKLNDTLNDLIEIVSNSRKDLPKLDTVNFKCVFEDICRSINLEIERINPSIILDFKTQDFKYTRSYLESIFLNMLTNAIKYRDKERKLTIHISTYEDDRYVYLKVSDNGIGMDLKKNGQRLFELYQRFEPSIQGKGIGLFLVKSQVESLSGKLFVNSELGVGTTFTIAFLKEL